MAEIDNIVLEHLRHIRSTIDNLREDMREVKERLGIIVSQCTSMSNRLDHINARLGRIEERLSLADA